VLRALESPDRNTQIIIHNADLPYVVVDFFDADGLSRKDLAEIKFFLPRQMRPQRVTTMVLPWSG
jgi:hypothetical protein